MSTTPRKSGRPTNPIPREKLLMHARDCFAELGFSGASMNAIAQRSGIRKASLFHHFAGKEKLYIEVLSGVIGELSVFVQDAGLGKGTFVMRLDRLGELAERWLSDNPSASRLLVWEVLGQGAFSQSPAGEAVPITVREVARFLQQGMDEGAIPPQEPTHLAMSIISIHLMHFAVSGLTNRLYDSDVFSEAHMSRRVPVVREQIRRLCGVEETHAQGVN